MRDLLEIRVIAFSKCRRHAGSLSDEIDALVRADPSYFPSYLHRAKLHIREKRFPNAVQDVWFALLGLHLPEGLHDCAIDFLVLCLGHVPYLGMDVLFERGEQPSVELCRTTFNSLQWPLLSAEQKRLHNTVCQTVYEMSYSAGQLDLSDVSSFNCSAYAWTINEDSGKRQAIQLPERFSFLGHDRLAGCSAFTTHEQVLALQSSGFTHLVSLSMEAPFSESCFLDEIPNTNIPIPARRAPGFFKWTSS